MSCKRLILGIILAFLLVAGSAMAIDQRMFLLMLAGGSSDGTDHIVFNGEKITFGGEYVNM